MNPVKHQLPLIWNTAFKWYKKGLRMNTDFSGFVLIGLILVIILFILYIYFSSKYQSSLRNQIRDLDHRFRSKNTLHGQTFEQWMPFVQEYPGDPKNFRFLGSPIDGIQFEEDKIILVEFKTGNSALKTQQRLIRDLVKANKVEWLEFRIN